MLFRSEAASLAGTLGLGKLIAIYDDNGISIDGEVDQWFTDDTAKRFEAYGWQVIRAVDGHDAAAVKSALESAAANTAQPTLIACKTVIGFGSPNKQGKESSHGAPLGDDEVALARETLGWSHAPFEIPPDVYAAWNGKARGEQLRNDWEARFRAYREAHPTLAEELERRLRGELPASWESASADQIAQTDATAATIATRAASLQALEAFEIGRAHV